MLVDQRRTRGAVTTKGHHLLEAGTRHRGQGQTSMPEVVEVDTCQTDLGPGTAPCSTEVLHLDP